jgi:hypothetical protein
MFPPFFRVKSPHFPPFFMVKPTISQIISQLFSVKTVPHPSLADEARWTPRSAAARSVWRSWRRSPASGTAGTLGRRASRVRGCGARKMGDFWRSKGPGFWGFSGLERFFLEIGARFWKLIENLGVYQQERR